MDQDESLSMPNRRATTLDNAERVHTELVSQAVARQVIEQQQASTSANIPTRRERKYLNRKLDLNNDFIIFFN